MFYSGFSLHKEEVLFEGIYDSSEFCVCGFSYGAILAFKKVLKTTTRVDKLQLISPAFFQNKDNTFKSLQLKSYLKNEDLYTKRFLKNISSPSNIDMTIYYKEPKANDLSELLNFIFLEDDLKYIQNKGIKIEVYLGEKDKIIDVDFARDFFIDFATIFYVKDVGHILKGE